MKIGILSDTHLSNITKDFREMTETVFADADMIVHAGDMTGRPIFDYLSNWELRAVRGNMDDYDLSDLLPEKRIEEIMGRKIGIIHGHGAPEGIEDRVMRQLRGVDIIIFGHSHVPLAMKRDSVILFNPGSYRGRYGYRGSVGVMEIGENITFRHVEV